MICGETIEHWTKRQIREWSFDRPSHREFRDTLLVFFWLTKVTVARDPLVASMIEAAGKGEACPISEKDWNRWYLQRVSLSDKFKRFGQGPKELLEASWVTPVCDDEKAVCVLPKNSTGDAVLKVLFTLDICSVRKDTELLLKDTYKRIIVPSFFLESLKTSPLFWRDSCKWQVMLWPTENTFLWVEKLCIEFTRS